MKYYQHKIITVVITVLMFRLRELANSRLYYTQYYHNLPPPPPNPDDCR